MFQQQIQPITAELNKINSRGYSRYGIFDDWLDLMIYAFTGNDEEYLKIVRKYKNDYSEGQREIDYFKNALCLLMAGMARTNEELLGEMYMEWNISNKHTGQFFTPHHVAKLCAEVVEPIEGNILDPACGAGMMLVQTAKTMTNKQLDNSTFYAKDIDLTCVKMCALNMMFFNLNALIECGNSLMMEHPSRVYRTKRSYLGGSLYEIDPATVEMIKEEEVEVVRPFIPFNRDNLSQMSLFN
jgi:hypothetical protein